MKKVRLYLVWLCIGVIMLVNDSVYVLANSAQSHWVGTTATGAIVTDDTCPIIVEDEILTFDIQEFPQQYYKDVREYLEYDGKVTAEYAFYNPADYTVDATLVFPFGSLPDYGYLHDQDTGERILNSDTDKYAVTVNGEVIEKKLRHTLMFYGAQFELEEDLKKLHDGYITDDFYAPDLPVTKYTYQASDVDMETYDAASAAFVLSADPERTKVYMEKQCGGATVEDGVRLDTWVELDEPFSVYVMGEALGGYREWKFYENGACEKEIDGVMKLIDTEVITLRDFVLSEYDEGTGILDYDWYNAIITSFKQFEWEYGAINSTEVNMDIANQLMRWYQYDISIEPRERIINTVTAPIYPSINSDYEPPIYEYTYLLSPAQTWREFGNLDIFINSSYYMQENTQEGFTWNNPGYELHLTGLPEGELTFTLCEEKNPVTLVREFSYMGIVWGVVIVMGIVVIGMIAKRRKKKKKKR